MPSVLAIVSKAIFERDAKLGGQLAKVADVVPMDRYVSKNKGLAPVAEGGALFLVTVRPPDEALWLVAVLESPTFDGENWVAAVNTRPITDITSLKGDIKFTTGTGISAKKGALGMSLQTPRILSEADEALLRSGHATSPASVKGHLNSHETSGPTPCLCRTCLPSAPEKVTVGTLTLVRERAEAGGRFLWYWMPESLEHDRAAVRRAVESRLHGRKASEKKRQFSNIDEVLGSAGSGSGDDE